MALDTYANLQLAVANWVHRTDLASIMPDLIALAENRINGDLDARLQDTVATLTATAGNQVVALPTDIINMRSLTVQSTPNMVLDYVTPDQFNTLYPDTTRTGVPQTYTIIGSNIYMAPKPDSAYSIQCIYKARVAALSNSNTTNWVLTTYPHVYLQATVCEAAKYTRNDQLLNTAEKAYSEAINTVNAIDWYSGSTMRVRTDVRS